MTPQYTKNETLLKMENISLTLGNNLILRDVNLEIKDIVRPDMQQGQVITVLGPSGIGKTQLFKILAGLINPSAGTCKITEHQEAVELGDVGVVQQNYPLFEHRTVYGNLQVGARRLPKADREDQIKFYLDSFGLTDKKDLYPVQLSGGQKQRVAIAQALIASKHFLLLDEPFSGLDITAIEKVSEMLLNVSIMDELNTIFIVSHDITASCAISDTVLLIGKDKNPDGTWQSGAYIKKQYDLIERGLAWRKDIRDCPEFLAFTKEVRNEYKNLA